MQKGSVAAACGEIIERKYCIGARGNVILLSDNFSDAVDLCIVDALVAVGCQHGCADGMRTQVSGQGAKTCRPPAAHQAALGYLHGFPGLAGHLRDEGRYVRLGCRLDRDVFAIGPRLKLLCQITG